MDVREKLVELLTDNLPRIGNLPKCDNPLQYTMDEIVERIADHLIAHGVTVQELDGCFRCKDSQKMTVAISNKLIDGVNVGWLGGNLPARFCPFCGRRLPQPSKGE